MTKSVLFIGEEKPGSRASQRLRAMCELGHEVTFVRSHPADETYETRPSLARRIRHRVRRPADRADIGGTLRRLAGAGPARDIVWIDYVLTIRPADLAALRAAWPNAKLVWYSEDDMMRPGNSSVWLERSIPFFDLWVTTKSFNAAPDEMPARGARKVMFVDNSYDRHTHRPVCLDPEMRIAFGAEASFVGTFEPARASSLLRVADAGIAVRIWGNGWRNKNVTHPLLTIEDRPAYGDDLARVYCASALNLAFLRKLNRDVQTCRTVEIPACGAFMLHERTEEARGLLAEDREAAYFSDDDELVARCRHWLDRPAERNAIAEAGRKKISAGGFSHHGRIAQIFDRLTAGQA